MSVTTSIGVYSSVGPASSSEGGSAAHYICCDVCFVTRCRVRKIAMAEEPVALAEKEVMRS